MFFVFKQQKCALIFVFVVHFLFCTWECEVKHKQTKNEPTKQKYKKQKHKQNKKHKKKTVDYYDDDSKGDRKSERSICRSCFRSFRQCLSKVRRRYGSLTKKPKNLNQLAAQTAGLSKCDRTKQQCCSRKKRLYCKNLSVFPEARRECHKHYGIPY